MYKFYRNFPIVAIISACAVINAAEVNSWECSKFEDSKIVSSEVFFYSDRKGFSFFHPRIRDVEYYNGSLIVLSDVFGVVELRIS